MSVIRLDRLIKTAKWLVNAQENSTLLTSFQRELIYSQLLGDGHLATPKFMSIIHAKKYQDYANYKRELLNEAGFTVTPFTYHEYNSNLSSDKNRFSRFHVKLPEAVCDSSHLSELVNGIGPQGLLLWWLDNGSFHVHEKKNGVSVSRFGYFHTQRYGEVGNIAISSLLYEKFGIETKVHIDRGGINGKDLTYYRLYVNATNMRHLIDIVRAYLNKVPAVMMYKFNMGYRPTRRNPYADYMNLYNF